jgi:polysaccharide biosynthesis/export protein
MNKNILSALFLLVFFSSCLNVKKYRDEMQLFQKGLDSIGTYQYTDLKIKAGDNLIVKVYTQATNNQEQATILNMGGMGKTDGTYWVNNQGQIDLPKIGLQKVEGLTMKELKKMLLEKWTPFIKDIGVNVQLEEITVNLLGEFRNAGAKKFKTEKITIIDAITAGNGLTDDGKRNDVLLIREENGKRTIYKIDFRDAQLYNSPAFQLQQNDLIVAGMNDFKFRQRASADFNQKLSPILTYMGFFNFALGIAILITTLSN